MTRFAGIVKDGFARMISGRAVTFTPSCGCCGPCPEGFYKMVVCPRYTGDCLIDPPPPGEEGYICRGHPIFDAIPPNTQFPVIHWRDACWIVQTIDPVCLDGHRPSANNPDCTGLTCCIPFGARVVQPGDQISFVPDGCEDPLCGPLEAFRIAERCIAEDCAGGVPPLICGTGYNGECFVFHVEPGPYSTFGCWKFSSESTIVYLAVRPTDRPVLDSIPADTDKDCCRCCPSCLVHTAEDFILGLLDGENCGLPAVISLECCCSETPTKTGTFSFRQDIERPGRVDTLTIEGRKLAADTFWTVTTETFVNGVSQGETVQQIGDGEPCNPLDFPNGVPLLCPRPDPEPGWTDTFDLADFDYGCDRFVITFVGRRESVNPGGDFLNVEHTYSADITISDPDGADCRVGSCVGGSGSEATTDDFL